MQNVGKKSFDQKFEAGLDKLELGDYEESIEFFSLAIKADPKNHEGYRWRAYPKNEIKDTKGAIADMNRAIELTSDQATILYYKGVIERYNDNNQKAMEFYNEAIKSNPDNELMSHILYSRSFIPEWLPQNSTDLAEPANYLDISFHDLTQALEYQKDNIMALKRRAYLYEHNGMYQEAIADYYAAIKFRPHHGDFYTSIGYSLYKLGEYQKAIENYEKAIQLDPEHDARAYINLGICKEHLGDKSEAN